ncbi:MAG TPA: Zn-ribbon domain-containing OB-fold protein [Actinomycetota bacterium]|nr:Zn-ribbon domain-containing OB-fold protein [Actinomycetota bacterium]
MGRDGGPPATGTQLQTPPRATPGRSLSDSEFRSATGAVDDEVGARYAWDAGVAIGRFLDGLRDGKVFGRECRNCERVLVPPRMFCERCFRGTDAWVQVEDTGVVQTYSICHVSWDMQQLQEPELPAVISIDGSDGGLLHTLGEVAPDDVSIGMAVEAVWKPVGERTGSILDIAYFRPSGGAGGSGSERVRASARPPDEGGE